MQSSAFSCAASVAKYFAMPASRSARSPRAFVLRGLEREQARRLGPGRHLREHQLHRLVLADLLAERLALLRVAERVVEGGLRDARRRARRR